MSQEDWLEPMIAGLAKQEAGRRDLNSRELRAIKIAAKLEVRGRPGRWVVGSQTGNQTYRVSGFGACSCPDRVMECKHSLAVRYVEMAAHEVASRLGLERFRWRGQMDELEGMSNRYGQLLDSAKNYRPPAVSTLLFGYRLECIGDDSFYRPVSQVRDLQPRRPWVARIGGLCPQYEFVREFCRGNKDYADANKKGSRGVWLYFQLPPGLYEIHQLLSYRQSRRFFAKVEGLRLFEIEKRGVIECLSETTENVNAAR